MIPVECGIRDLIRSKDAMPRPVVFPCAVLSEDSRGECGDRSRIEVYAVHAHPAEARAA
jgi:hypothetical protein